MCEYTLTVLLSRRFIIAQRLDRRRSRYVVVVVVVVVCCSIEKSKCAFFSKEVSIPDIETKKGRNETKQAIVNDGLGK